MPKGRPTCNAAGHPVACRSTQPRSVRTVTTGKRQSQTILPGAILRQINVSQINVRVPTSLKVSEANRYYPNGDIVWREDPMGNRHAQVAKIVHDAMTVGTQSFTGPVPVILDIELVRFHALSEKARYTVGGVHNVILTWFCGMQRPVLPSPSRAASRATSKPLAASRRSRPRPVA